MPAVPEPPDCADIPDIGSLLDLPASQWLQSTQPLDKPGKEAERSDISELREEGQSYQFGSLSQLFGVPSQRESQTRPSYQQSQGTTANDRQELYLNSDRHALSSNQRRRPQNTSYKSLHPVSRASFPDVQSIQTADVSVSRQQNSSSNQRTFRPTRSDNNAYYDISHNTIQPRVGRPSNDFDAQGPGGDADRPSTRIAKTPHLHEIGQQKDRLHTPTPLIIPITNNERGVQLRSIAEIPKDYRRIFPFSYFNIVQSKIIDDVLYTDNPLVICAPTGSGKTVAFELAIVRLLTSCHNDNSRNFKVVYMAPIKALCSERYSDWQDKFSTYGLKCKELTGDTEMNDIYELQETHIILTTPEKWDSMTRKWRDNKSFVDPICLFLIDEIHVLNDSTRGATVEAVISRMKTIQAARTRLASDKGRLPLRFLAISATITNIADIAEWLGTGKDAAIQYKMDDSVRPVRLRKVVLGYNFYENKTSEFQFDMTLNYKLSSVISTYADEKPTLIFCSTRKSAQQAAEILAKDARTSYIRKSEHRAKLANLSYHLKDAKLRDLVTKGLGFHHAGMDQQDRKQMEEIFAGGTLPVLVSTSTLAMGVNLPAHLVIIKSTMFYNMGAHQEYSDTQLLQMIGRAGRPQFDTSATAVIMTKHQTKTKYENLLNGTQLIESSLHKNLTEHLNAEIVLHTITDISVALEWLRHTFLYIRVMKNPKHYGIPTGLTKEQMEKRLQDLCMKSLNQLMGLKLITMDEETIDIQATESGRLMARYCISFNTMKFFLEVKGTETVSDLLTVVSKSAEFSDIVLRTNEKKTLNSLNKDKNKATIRYPINGKIKTPQMKTICLIQAQFGCLTVPDFSLQQDLSRIFRAGVRVTRCLVEVLWHKTDFKALLSALQLCKSFWTKLWDDSKFVSKQLEGIGPSLSTALVNAGIVSFEKIEETNPRELEMIVNRHPPFGNQIREAVSHLPKYELVIEQLTRYGSRTAEIVITVELSNQDVLCQRPYTGHTCTVVVGDEDNRVLFKQRIMDCQLLKEKTWSRKLDIKKAEKGPELYVHYISQDWVGLDIECTYTPKYQASLVATTAASVTQSSIAEIPQARGSGPTMSESSTDSPSTKSYVPCNHSCRNKKLCAHECCKTGVLVKGRVSQKAQQTPKAATAAKSIVNHMSEIRKRIAHFPETPSMKRTRPQSELGQGSENAVLNNLRKFCYQPKRIKMDDLIPQCVEQGTEAEFGYTDSHLNSTATDAATCTGSVASTRIDNIACVSNKRFPKTVQQVGLTPNRRGWEDLDLFIKHREQCNKEEEDLATSAMELESLPSLEERHTRAQAANFTSDLQLDDRDEGADGFGDFYLDRVQMKGNSGAFGGSIGDKCLNDSSEWQRVQGIDDFPNDEQCYYVTDEEHGFYYAQDYVGENQHGTASKWTNYDSSQSSTASDYLNQAFPFSESRRGELSLGCHKPPGSSARQKCRIPEHGSATRGGQVSLLNSGTVSHADDNDIGATRDVEKLINDREQAEPTPSFRSDQVRRPRTSNTCLNDIFKTYRPNCDGDARIGSRVIPVDPELRNAWREKPADTMVDKLQTPSYCYDRMQSVGAQRSCQLGQGEDTISGSETNQERHKFGQVLAWVSNSQGNRSSKSDQDWDSWSDDSHLGDIAETNTTSSMYRAAGKADDDARTDTCALKPGLQDQAASQPRSHPYMKATACCSRKEAPLNPLVIKETIPRSVPTRSFSSFFTD